MWWLPILRFKLIHVSKTAPGVEPPTTDGLFLNTLSVHYVSRLVLCFESLNQYFRIVFCCWKLIPLLITHPYLYMWATTVCWPHNRWLTVVFTWEISFDLAKLSLKVDGGFAMLGSTFLVKYDTDHRRYHVYVCMFWLLLIVCSMGHSFVVDQRH